MCKNRSHTTITCMDTIYQLAGGDMEYKDSTIEQIDIRRSVSVTSLSWPEFFSSPFPPQVPLYSLK